MRGCPERAVETVAPAVVGAPYRAAHVPLRLDQCHAPVPTGVLEDPDLAVMVAHQKKGHSGQVNRLHVAGFGNIRCNSDARPVPVEQGLPLLLEDGIADIVSIGQSAGGFDGTGHRFKPGR